METIITHTDEEITPPAFQLWLDHARPGDKFVYHRGQLAIDREDVIFIGQLGDFAHVYYEPFDTLGKMAWHAYERGDITLAQRLLPEGRHEYYAFKRRRLQ